MVLVTRSVIAGAFIAGLLAPATLTAAGAETVRSWRETKCERYRQAWTEVKRRFGTEGLGPAFIAHHDAFIASGCTADADVCPLSAREVEIANVLTIAAMNAGTASTFLPFACKTGTR